MSFQYKISYVFHILKSTRNHYFHAFIATVEVASIYRFILVLQRQKDFYRRYTQTRHLFLVNIYIYAWRCSTVKLHISYPFYIDKFTLDKLGITYHVTVGESIRRYRIEHTVHGTEIVQHKRH